MVLALLGVHATIGSTHVVVIMGFELSSVMRSVESNFASALKPEVCCFVSVLLR